MILQSLKDSLRTLQWHPIPSFLVDIEEEGETDIFRKGFQEASSQEQRMEKEYLILQTSENYLRTLQWHPCPSFLAGIEEEGNTNSNRKGFQEAGSQEQRMEQDIWFCKLRRTL